MCSSLHELLQASGGGVEKPTDTGQVQGKEPGTLYMGGNTMDRTKAGTLRIWPVTLGLGAVVALFFWQPLVSPADAPTISTVPDAAYSDAFVTNGDVNAIVRSGDTTFIGGSFTLVGPRTGHGVPISAATGAPTSGFPDVAGGDVLAAVSDGSGGWVIGGDFTVIGGVSRNRVAHFNSDGSLDTSWDLDVNDTVRTIVVSAGVVFIGGDFTTVKGGTTRNHIAAFNLGDGSLRSWNPNVTGISVNTIYVNGSDVTIGGDFSQILGTARNKIGVVDNTEPTPNLGIWDPNADGSVNALAVYGNFLFVGGGFSNIGGQARTRFAVFRISTGDLLAPAPVFNGSINAFRLSGTGGTTLYVGGVFTSIDATSRNRLAAFDANTGTVLGWNPDVDGTTVHALSASAVGSTVYVGGDFSTVNGESVDRNRIAAFDSTSATTTSWNPSASHDVKALAASGSDVFAGGTFASIGARERNRLAALDSNGQLTSWNPNANATVHALTASTDGNTMYAGGEFTTVNGSTTRNGIAALSASTGTATGWNPNANNFVRALAVSGTTVFAGGDFTTIGGASRGRFSALDGSSGAALGGNVNADNSVNTVGISGGSVVTGGAFTSIGGQTRNRLAAFNLSNGSLQSWNPNANDVVEAVAFTDNAVIAGGDFTTIGGQARRRLAAIDPNSGAAVGVDPDANGGVASLAVGGNSILIGGAFTSIGGQSRSGLAATNLEGTQVLDWNPSVDARVNALAYSGSTVHAGGAFNTVGTQSNEGYAQFTAAPTNSAAPSISGSNVAGSTLTCSSGTWDDTNATLAYQWLKDGASISGATNSTHMTSDADVGVAITCQVTATNIGGSSSATSASVTVEATPVSPAQPVTPAPSTGESSAPSLTNAKASPRCVRNKSSKFTSKKMSRKSKRASKADKSRKRKHSSKRTKANRKVGSKLKLKFTLSERSEVTISIRKREGSHRPSKSCPSKKKKGNATEQPGQYEEVETITQSVDAGSASKSLSLRSESSNRKSRSKDRGAAKSSKTIAFQYSLKVPDMTNGQNVSPPPSAAQSEKQTAVKKKHAIETGTKSKGSQGVRSQVSTSFSRNASAGNNSVDASGSSVLKNLKPGTYKAYISAKNSAGLESTTQAVKFWVLSR